MKTLNIFVLDDSITFLSLIEEYLQSLEITPKGYTNWRQLMSDCTNEMPDVAILDINLHDELTGFDVADRIQAINPHCKLIFMSCEMNMSKLQQINNEKRGQFVDKMNNFLEELVKAIERAAIETRLIIERNAARELVANKLKDVLKLIG